METIETVVSRLLPLVDAEPGREGLRETPKRYEQFLGEFLQPKPYNFTTFASEGYEEMVCQSKIPFYSICEHHLVPFFGTGTIAYIPGASIVGLSKLARALDQCSRRLQNQERITTEVAAIVMDILKPKGVAVHIKARHLCMEMRGIQKPGVQTTTFCLKGVFASDTDQKQAFLQLVD